MLHVACFIAKSVRFMTALDVGGIGCVGGAEHPSCYGPAGWRLMGCGETMRGPVFWKTSNRVFRLGLVDTDLVTPAVHQSRRSAQSVILSD